MTPLWLTLVIVAFVAACVGSFCTVVIDRMPVEYDEPDQFGDLFGARPWREVLGGRSRCSSCGESVKLYENIPILAFLALRGKCRHCSAPIPRWVLVVEVLVPALAVWTVWVQGWTWTTAPTLLLIPVGVVIAAIDLRTLIVPTIIVWPALGAAVVLCGAIAIGEGEYSWLVAGLIGVAVMAGPLFVLWWFNPRGMGFGDVRLAVLIGWIVGFEAGVADYYVVVYSIIVLFVLSSLLGIVLGVASAILQFRGIKRVPFGPALLSAALLVCLAVPKIQEALGR